MTEQKETSHPPVVPKQFAGQWIAWDRRQSRIVATGRTFQDARNAALEAGETDPLLAKAPPSDVRFVGCNAEPRVPSPE